MKTSKVSYTLRTGLGVGFSEFDHEILMAEVIACEDLDEGDAMMLEARRICGQMCTAAIKKRNAAAALKAAAEKEKETK